MPGLRPRSALVGVTRADAPRLGVMRTVVALLALTLFTACNSSSASAAYGAAYVTTPLYLSSTHVAHPLRLLSRQPASGRHTGSTTMREMWT